MFYNRIVHTKLKGDHKISSLSSFNGLFLLTTVTHGIMFRCTYVLHLTSTVDTDGIIPCYVAQSVHSSYAQGHEHM